MNSRRLLRDHRGGSKNVTPLETGTIRGQLRGMEIAGKPVIDVGVWHRRAARGAGAAKQLADLVRRPDKAPFISYMKGALLHSARQRRSARTDTPAKTPTCQADHEAERARPDDIHRRQPHPLVQVGMTSIFPPRPIRTHPVSASRPRLIR